MTMLGIIHESYIFLAPDPKGAYNFTSVRTSVGSDFSEVYGSTYVETLRQD